MRISGEARLAELTRARDQLVALAGRAARLTDPGRVLYQRLGIRCAPVRRVYSPGTLVAYAAAATHGRRPARGGTPASSAPT